MLVNVPPSSSGAPPGSVVKPRAVRRAARAAIVLPASLSRVSATAGGFWFFGVGIWPIASLPANGSATFTVTFRPTSAGQATIRAVVSASRDPDPRNNVTSAVIA